MYINNLMCTLFNVCILISFATTRTLRNYCVKRYFLLPTCVSGYIRLWYHIHLFFQFKLFICLIWYVEDTSIKMVNYVKVKIMFRYIIGPLTFNRLVNGSIRCCTGYMWNSTIEDCIGTKGFHIRFIIPDLTISLV